MLAFVANCTRSQPLRVVYLLQVDTNLNQLKKLPKYARFGRPSETCKEVDTTGPRLAVHLIWPHLVSFLLAAVSASVEAPPAQASSVLTSPITETEAEMAPVNGAFRPTRRVRDVPGGYIFFLYAPWSLTLMLFL
jgi:hypothetical protein